MKMLKCFDKDGVTQWLNVDQIAGVRMRHAESNLTVYIVRGMTFLFKGQQARDVYKQLTTPEGRQMKEVKR